MRTMLPGCCLLLIVAGCEAFDTLPAPSARPIDYRLNIQPIVVSDDWTQAGFDEQIAALGPAFAQAGIAFDVLAPIELDAPAWETIDDLYELRTMMNSAQPNIRLFLVRSLNLPWNGGAGLQVQDDDIYGATFPPQDVCFGVALATAATRDRNALVHEMGHALGLLHPAAGPWACDDESANCLFMSYCTATRNQFTVDEIETMRYWAAVMSGG